MSEPLLSIITINFNNKNGLQKTMDSVLNQSFQDYEYIIVDGGSSDGSKELIESYSGRDDFKKRVAYWCSEKDSGIYNAMNKGMRHASGNWVYMLNSGDALVNNVLNPVSNILHKHKYEVVYGSVDCYKKNEFFRTACASAENLKDGMIPHQGTFIPFKLHEKFGFYDEKYKIVSDREFMLRLKTNGINFSHMPIVVCYYDEEGISATNMKQVSKENKKIDQIYFPLSLRTKILNLIKTSIKLILPGFITLLLKKIYELVKLYMPIQMWRGGIGIVVTPGN